MLLSDFSVDGRRIAVLTSTKSFVAKDGSDEPPSLGRNGQRDFHREPRSMIATICSSVKRALRSSLRVGSRSLNVIRCPKSLGQVLPATTLACSCAGSRSFYAPY